MGSQVIVISGSSGAATITKEQENDIRRYLFGQLEGADEEGVELRLLTDAAFVEEFDTVVDEVTDQYLQNELQDAERKGFEAKFLATAEGQQKLTFASELLERASAERGPSASRPVPETGFFESIRAFWQSQSMRLAASAAALVIIAVGIFLITKPVRVGPASYATVNLSISDASRNEGPAAARVKLESGMAGIQATLTIPEQVRGAKDYRVKLVTGDLAEHDLSIEQRTDQTVTVKVQASLLSRGRYALQVFSINATGNQQRIPGSYYFDVE